MLMGNKYLPQIVTASSSAPFSPSDISGLTLWLDASDINTLWQDTAATSAVTTDSQLVARWDDKSGNSANVTCGTPADQPTYKTGIQNSLPSLLFDGTNYLDSVATFNGYPITIIAVVKNGSTSGTARGIAATYRSGGVGGIRYYMNSTNTITGYIADTGTSVTKQNTAVTIASDTTLIAGTQTDSGNLYTLVNGTSQTSPHTLANISGNIRIGGYNAGSLATLLDGFMCELVFYNSLLSSGDVTSVTDYLNSKWGVY